MVHRPHRQRLPRARGPRPHRRQRRPATRPDRPRRGPPGLRRGHPRPTPPRPRRAQLDPPPPRRKPRRSLKLTTPTAPRPSTPAPSPAPCPDRDPLTRRQSITSPRRSPQRIRPELRPTVTDRRQPAQKSGAKPDPISPGFDAVLQICSQCQGVVAADVGGGWDPAAGDLARRFAASPRRDGMNW